MRRSPRTTRLAVEVLEDRSVPSATIIDLGPGFVAKSINNSGLVAGSANGHAALWHDGATTDLGTLGGATSQANDINEAGQVVGYADTGAGARHAFLVEPEDTDSDGQPDRWFRDNDLNGVNDLMLDLGTLGGPASEARGINNLGQVIGRADESTLAGSYRAFVWDSATGMRNLGTFGLPTDPDGQNSGSEANAINDHGQVVGSVYGLWRGLLSNRISPFVWDADSGGTLLPHYAAKATDINESGQIVGNSGQIARGMSLFPRWYVTSDASLWQHGYRTDLGFTTPDNGGLIPYEFDVAINRHTQVVGLGYLWQDGVRTDLSSLPDAALGWGNFISADISDAAQIVGQGTRQGVSSSFLLSHVAPPLPPSLSIRDVSVTEGDSGTVNAVFTVNLSRAVDQAVTVDFSTADGSAKAGSDYTTSAGTVTFAPGEISKTITVSVLGDTRDEYDETFQVNLSNAANAALADGQGLATLLDNDPAPALSINDVTVKEGKSGVTYFFFTVTLSAASDKTISVNFATSNGTATTGNNDYVATYGTLTFAPGETTKTVMVQVKGDKKKEANETFYVDLSGAVDALLTRSRGIGTILNDD